MSEKCPLTGKKCEEGRCGIKSERPRIMAALTDELVLQARLQTIENAKQWALSQIAYWESGHLSHRDDGEIYRFNRKFCKSNHIDTTKCDPL